MKPNNTVYTELKSQFLDNIQDARMNDQKTCSILSRMKRENGILSLKLGMKNEPKQIRILRNCFDDIVTDEKIAYLLNYRFSKFGDYIGETKISQIDISFVSKKVSISTHKSFPMQKTDQKGKHQ